MHCILMYHFFGAPNPSPAADPLYCISDELFQRHLHCLAESGRQVVDVGLALQNSIPEGDRISITIDDGDISVFTHALPLLQKHQMPATVYLVTGQVGSPGFLSWENIRECRKGGITFQSHTHSHRNLERLSEAEIREELSTSKKILEDTLGEPIEGLALPGGKGNRQVIGKIARETGYRYILTSAWGYNRGEVDPCHLERISWMRTQTFALFQQFVKGDESALTRMKLRAKVIHVAKQILGERRYEQFKRVIG
jgi:peptidoglycan/xylan/chitin deacetylase (PgdA/CDA1 family)